ncbi:MAG: gliding motility-associated C-terminal domain-containing protein, partial [Bacteroidota bacterium]
DSTVANQPLGRGLSYFIIDMALNGGLGGVRLADQRVFVPAYEGLDATPMADGSGYWIICHNDIAELPRFIITPLTAAGVGTPVTYPTREVGGKLEFSPDGSMLFHRGTLFSFDTTTGLVGTELGEFPRNANQAACFTPDSRFLYTIESRPALGEVIVRYNLSDFSVQLIEPLASAPNQTVLATASFQIGPNGNIYFVEQTIENGTATSYGLSEITCVSSPEPSVTRNLIDLPIFERDLFLPQSLPQYVDAIFSTPAEPDTIVLQPDTLFICGEEAITLRTREVGEAYAWSTGAEEDSITVNTPGTYCLTITNGCTPVVDCKQVSSENPAFTARLATTEDRGCEGVFSTYVLSLAGAVTEGSLMLVAQEEDGTTTPLYSATFSDTIVTLPQFPDERETILSIFISTENCTDLLWAENIEPFLDDRFAPRLNVGFVTEACTGQPLTIEALSEGSIPVTAVRWPDGSQENPRTLEAVFGMTYEAMVFSECGDSTLLIYDGMDIAEFCDCEPQIPELITPNGDGRNDQFQIFANCPVNDYTLMIFNRWGQPVFETTDPNQAWDGNRNGTPQNADTYLYRMVFRFPDSDEVIVREGQFSLLR